MKRPLIVAALPLILVGCAHAVPVAPVVPMRTTALCVDMSNVVVPDNYCPIGDGLGLNAGYGWDYYPPYSDGLDAVVVPYVGYPVGSGWSRQRPVNVTTINIQRGVAAPVPPGVTATVAKVPSKPASTITRGGLGVKPTPVVVAKAPAPAPRPPAPVSRKMGK